MSHAPDTTPSVSRRMWLSALFGGLLSGPFLWWFDLPDGTRTPPSETAEAPSGTFVDRDGWMLTPEDAARLASAPAAR